MKLKLKHLAPYLPYQLRFQTKFDNSSYYMAGLEISKSVIILKAINNAKNVKRLLFKTLVDTKPILRPLSDLTKEQFNHIWNEETDFLSIELIVGMDAESFCKSEFTFGFYNSLFENHFDIFGLIPEGLAIDINTLK